MIYDRFQELAELRAALEREYRLFPLARCCEASRAVYEALGLREVAGKYKGEGHAWNEDTSRGLWIDLTFSQFEPHAPDILVVPKGWARLEPNARITEVQRGLELPGIDLFVETFQRQLLLFPHETF